MRFVLPNWIVVTAVCLFTFCVAGIGGGPGGSIFEYSATAQPQKKGKRQPTQGEPGKGNAAAAQIAPDPFDEETSKAVRVPTIEAMASLFWSQDANCTAIENSFEKRQCEMVQATRLSSVVGRDFYLQENGIDAGMLSMGAFDEKRNSAALALSACLYCAENDPALILGKSKPKVINGQLVGGNVTTKHFQFASKSDADRFRSDVLRRLIVEVLAEVKPRAAFRAGKRKGYRANLSGYRVYDPCTGTILLTSSKYPLKKKRKAAEKAGKKILNKVPAAVMAPKDSKVCKGVKRDGGSLFGTKKSALPGQLSNAAISEALQPVIEEARRCYSIYQVRGRSTLRLQVKADGQIESFVHNGDFKDTPTGECIDEKVRTVRFPKTSRPTTEVLYPVRLP